MKEYTEEGCVNIVAATYVKCLKPTRDMNEINNRLNFLDNSPLFDLWCTVTGKDSTSLRYLAKIRNHAFLRDIMK